MVTLYSLFISAFSVFKLDIYGRALARAWLRKVIDMKRFKNILCKVEPVEVSRSALERAVTLAENNQARLTVIDVVERVTSGTGMLDSGPASADLQTAMVNDRAQALEVLVEPYRTRVMINTKVLVGTSFLEIIYEVLRNNRDLLIKVSEAQDWLGRLFGSDDMHLLRKCPCPVWLIGPDEPTSYQCVLAAVDVDGAYPPAEVESLRALNRQILEMASSLALAEFARLHIVHVWEAIGESILRSTVMYTPEEKIAAYTAQVKRQHEASIDRLIGEVTSNLGRDALDYLKLETHLLKGAPRKEVPALAKRIEADLVVMGTVARTGIPGFIMGNTAETILNQIDCSALAIKPPGFMTPVTLEE